MFNGSQYRALHSEIEVKEEIIVVICEERIILKISVNIRRKLERCKEINAKNVCMKKIPFDNQIFCLQLKYFIEHNFLINAEILPFHYRH